VTRAAAARRTGSSPKRSYQVLPLKSGTEARMTARADRGVCVLTVPSLSTMAL